MDSDQELILTQTENAMTKKRRSQIDIECQAYGCLRNIFDTRKRELQIKILEETANGDIDANEALQELDKFEKERDEIESAFMGNFSLRD